MNNKSLCYFGFNIYCSGKGNVYNDVALEIYRRLNVRWSSCKMLPPNIFAWNNIEVFMSDKDKYEMNIFMEELTIKYRKCNKIHDLEWWYSREKR